MSKTVTVLGNGQLALAMLDKLRASGLDTLQMCRPEFDITDPDCIQRISAHTAFVVNCIAYNDVDGAEDDTKAAEAVNFHAVARLAKYCAAQRLMLVHVSTDFVFDGLGRAPYREDDKAEPVSAYGASKLFGEEAVAEEMGDLPYLIVRTSSLWTDHPARRNNFPYKIMQRVLEGKVSWVLRGRQMVPTFAPHLADGIIALLDFQFANKRSKDHIYHITNSGPVVSWYEFASTFCSAHKVPNHKRLIQPTWKWESKAVRPLYSALSSEKFTCRTEHEMPTWMDSIKEVAES